MVDKLPRFSSASTRHNALKSGRHFLPSSKILYMALKICFRDPESVSVDNAMSWSKLFGAFHFSLDSASLNWALRVASALRKIVGVRLRGENPKDGMRRSEATSKERGVTPH